MPTFNRSGAVGSGFAPRVYLYSCLLCAIAIILESMLSKKQNDKKISTNPLVVKVIVTGIIYAITINFLGYFISTLITIMILMQFLGAQKWRQITSISIGFLIVVYVVFVVLLSVPVPKAAFLGGVI
jgi:hypothetical protein